MDHENDPGWKYLRRTREQIMEDQSRPFDHKKDCWVPDEEEGYVAAQIKSTSGDQVTVTIVGGSEKSFKKDVLQEIRFNTWTAIQIKTENWFWEPKRRL